ncbi:hypothetical protein [uncultured Tateyamaria sp.]|uniref:hypothetical protein n=1 Tax=uncultured Tateyamaria sp. TaxID=455651 RepID=UPI00261ED9AD|nr:hypothetical protein [uncultured Tateyamaria sp.]
MSDLKTENTPRAVQVQALEETVIAQRKEIAFLKGQIKTLERGHWVNEACGDDLWDL